MNLALIKDLSPQERAELQIIYENSKKLLDKLDQIVYTRISTLRDVKTPDYEHPSWAFKQAHTNGIVEGLEFIRMLLNNNKRK